MPRAAPLLVLVIGLSPVCLAQARAADEPASASETAGRWLGGTNEAVQGFGKAGESLGVVTAKSLVGAGTGSAKRSLAAGWNTTLQGWQATSAATKNSLPYSVAPGLFTGSEVLTSVVAPAIEGDGKGVVSGALNIGAASVVAAEGAVAGAKLFGAIGGAVGSFVPVVGTAAGAMVGGAIGTVTGGFVASIAYDRYGKSVLTKVAEGGLSALTDPDPLQVAIAAREDFMRKQAAPELQANWDYAVGVSQGFGQEEALIPKPLTGVYQPRVAPPTPAPPPPAGATAPQIEALKSATQIAITVWSPDSPEYKIPGVCRITGTAVRCTSTFKFGAADASSVANNEQQGVLQGNTITGNARVVVRATISNGTPCKSYTYEYTHRETIRFSEDGSLTIDISGSTGRLTENNCAPEMPATTSSPNSTSVGTWRVLQ